MSDDVISNFLQSQPASKSGAGSITVQGDEAQGSDFSRVFSVEEEKLNSNKTSDVRETETENKVSIEEQEQDASFVEATRRQNNDQGGEDSGNGLPNLALHHGALAVGRVIYTSNRDSVTPESLSKFISRQSLVVDSLGDSKKSVAGQVGSTENGVGITLPVNNFGIEQYSGISAPTKLESLDSVRENQSALEMLKAPKQQAEADTFSKLNKQSTGQPSIGAFSPESEPLISGAGMTNIGSNSSGFSIRGVDEINLKNGQNPNQAGGISQISPGIDQHGSDNSFENLEREAKAKPQEYKLETPETVIAKSKEEVLGRERITEIKKEQAHGQLHLQQFLGGVRETLNTVRDANKPNLSLQSDIIESAIKVYKDAGQISSQESPLVESSQQRLEFKGALREVQRMVATNVYNNLTDSYESWNTRFGEVLANRIAGHISQENWNVQLKMNPASLGQISLEIDFSERGLEGRFGASEEATRQLLQDTLPRLRLALREILEGSHGLKLDIGDFDQSNGQDRPEAHAAATVIDEINFETEVLVGHTLDPELSSMVGLDILV